LIFDARATNVWRDAQFFPYQTRMAGPFDSSHGDQLASQIPGNHYSQGPSIRSQPPNIFDK
jgi:hypothetical protein